MSARTRADVAGGSSQHSSGVSVTYTSTQAFGDSQLCSHFLACLSSQLPLRNVAHHPPASPASGTRTIQSLPIRLVPLSDELLKAKHKPETRHLVQANLLERPFVHLFLVSTADSDHYRAQIRNEIRTWLSDLKDIPSLSAVPKSSAAPPGVPTSSDRDAAGSKEAKGSQKEEDGMPQYLIVYITPPAGSAANAAAGASSPGYFSQSSGSSPGSFAAGSAASPGTPRDDAVASTPKTAMSRFLSSTSSASNRDATGGVLEKLKTDFGGGKKTERIVHVARLPPPALADQPRNAVQFTDPTIFADLLNPLKQLVAATLDSAVTVQRDESAKLRSLHTVRGWNPVGVFGKMECLGNTYESIGIYEEGLRCFDEIDEMYKQGLQDGELTFFPSIAPTSLSEGEDSLSVLSATAKPYRDMILHNSASLWDLKKYLLARRLMLLSKMGRGLAVMRETLRWLAEATRMVQGQDLPPHCLAAFYISATLDIVHHCFHLLLSPSGVLTSALPTPTFAETIGAKPEHLDRLPASFHALSGEILSMALRQLERIGMSFEYLPATLPFIAQDSMSQLNKTRETTGITRQELLKALENETTFLEFHGQLSQRTLRAMSRGGRFRAQREIEIGLATLQLHNGDTAKAHDTFSRLLESQPDSASRWPSEEHLLLQRHLECHSKLAMPFNRTWVASVVSLLRCIPALRSGRPGLQKQRQPSDHAAYWNDEAGLFEKLRTASEAFEREVPVSGFGRLSVIPTGRNAVLLEDQDGVSLSTIVYSDLESDLQVDDVRFCLKGGDTYREQLWLTSGPVLLRPGRNEVVLRALSNAPGKYCLDVTQIRLSRVVFQYATVKSPPVNASTSIGTSGAPLITIPRDGDALDATIETPNFVALDQPRFCELVVQSRRNHVATASLRVKHRMDGRPLMGFGAGELIDSPSSAALKSSHDGLALELHDVPARSTVTIRFPLDEAPPSDGSAIALLLDFDFHTATDGHERPQSARRTFRKNVELSTALPLGVNVQDFFRFDALMCKFSISTGGGSTLAVKEARLELDTNDAEPSAGYRISGPEQSVITVVTPRQPAAYVFKIERHHSASGQSLPPPPPAASMRLSIVYSSLHETAKQLVSAILDRVINAEAPTLAVGLQTLLRTAFMRLTDKCLNVPTFALTGAVRLAAANGGEASGHNRAYWRRLVSERWGLSRDSEALAQILRITEIVEEEATACGPAETSGHSGKNKVEITQRTLQIPVEVPQMDIVNSVSIRLLSDIGGCAQSRQNSTVQEQTCAVGRPVRGEIRISSTFRWSTKLWPRLSVEIGSSSLGLPDTAKRLEVSSGSPSQTTDPSLETASSAGGDFTTDAGSVFEDAISNAGSDATHKGAEPVSSQQGGHRVDAKESKVAAQSALKQTVAAAPSQRMTYEVQSDFNNWIVSGVKRGVFQLPLPSKKSGEGDRGTIVKSPDEPMCATFPITLIPLRAGPLTMPNVAVWPLAEEPTSLPPSLAHGGGRTRGATASRPPLPSCETFVSNAAERVQVVDVDALIRRPGGGSSRAEQGKQGDVDEAGEDEDGNGRAGSKFDEMSWDDEDEDGDRDEGEGEEAERGQGEKSDRLEDIVLPGETFWIPQPIVA
ncbi:unnamed protein product [Parajaminaea phylloscopi]